MTPASHIPDLPSPGGLQDRQGRSIRYLRLSLTDRCNFRCDYCSAAGLEAPEALLGAGELARLVSLFARLGVRRVRLTGGEPTLRRDVVEVAAAVRAVPGIEEVALTTNGHRLAELAGPLHRAGVGAVNVSLDTLDPAMLERVSGRGARLADVLAGLDAAAAEGFAALKVNTVVMGGVNDGELAALTRHAWSRGATPRFIELMPFGSGRPVPSAEVERRLGEAGVALSPDPARGWGPARYLRGRCADGAGGLVGFIGALTENFCASCNRARISADGAFQACLGGHERVPLRQLLREGASDALLEDRVRGALWRKEPRHHMDDPARLVLLPMRGIGG
ncbi:GTP 3',8-cyclase MoaA [Anaeromyxobacter paludicola]|uniref:GTP 3',8-cyclase n=1 Tax=Anaeromyxobacter paludicola TaxID=2918171 RepID=A0ABM7XF51_9BACT|nr:GTP 3',8-cyclase MoaA [Anaeromyxobacter paludicola]BDG10541.1 cyclic pyranopterin monophosphate synthase [Anaeromyxobacter paludicola]